MQLFYAGPSPYARKVRAVIIERQLEAAVELTPCVPYAVPQDLVANNALSKVPTLRLGDGSSLFDSGVICEYLDTLGAGAPLQPSPGPARWTALRRQALADGLLDAGVLVRLERARPAGEQSPDWIAAQLQVVARALDAMAGEGVKPEDALTIGHVAFGCALGWLDFRMPELDWRSSRPELAAWQAGFSRRPSMKRTEPAA